ncbi:uncharacterized protein LOC117110167 [Anneissia japonica]|uniref:uncharacterized protein LOC117110167 n=1 Tax=Anneissia japonica TaxID=1529436 RepID=UPI00142567D1|nr:uncharacterized protein LOC117110167 [Anneissia japonica]
MSTNREIRKLERAYYAPQHLWQGEGAIDQLVSKTRIPRDVVKEWLFKQSMWQIYLPPPKHVPSVPTRQSVSVNQVHQADLLFLPHDRYRGKTYKYALTVVDVASRYKEAEPLTTKQSSEVSRAFDKIYARKLTWPDSLQVDSGSEFKGETLKAMKEHNVRVSVGVPGNHKSQGIVERFNKTLTVKLFPHQYAREMLDPSKRNAEWVENLKPVLKELNAQGPDEVVRGRDEIKYEPKYNRPVGLDERVLDSSLRVRYLYRPGELEGGERRRATDPIWSIDTYDVRNVMIKPQQPVLYFLRGVSRSFVREELLVVPFDTQLPPE